MRDALLDWLVDTTRPVTSMGKGGHVDDRSQLMDRYNNGYYRDGKIFPIKVEQGRAPNYL
jgi:hypothetical protein